MDSPASHLLGAAGIGALVILASQQFQPQQSAILENEHLYHMGEFEFLDFVARYGKSYKTKEEYGQKLENYRFNLDEIKKW